MQNEGTNKQNIKEELFCSFQRPLLVLVDRNVDLATPLHHTWTYQALAHDVLNLSLNRVSVTEQDPSHMSNRSKTKEYDLNNADNFWSAHKGISVCFILICFHSHTLQ